MTGPRGVDRVTGEDVFVIAFGYADGMLASSWYRAYKRAKQTIQRGSFRARVVLAPTNALPPAVDLLIVPAELGDAATGEAAVGEMLVADLEGLPQAFDRIVARFVRDGRLERGPASARASAVHRGFRAMGERAGLVG